MLLSVTLSKPVKNISEILDNDYVRIKFRLAVSSAAGGDVFFGEFYTAKQVFHKKFSLAEVEGFIEEHAGKSFRNCVQRTDTEEITLLANKKGKISRLVKKLNESGTGAAAVPSTAAKRGGWSGSGTADGPTVNAVNRDSPMKSLLAGKVSLNKKKNYILEEGKPVPFLVLLGIMTPEGKVFQAKYDKFRQINRFLELVNDVLPDVLKSKDDSPVTVVDFGSGKSYLTFAIHYFLTEIRHVECNVFGLDLKKDVIDYCNSLVNRLHLGGISFATGNIADFDRLKQGEKAQKSPDIIVTLHACDTATDYALDYAVRHNARAILSVPCCQHEINSQLKKNSLENPVLKPMLKYGIIKERLSALITDTLRAELLENCGYKVQILEFIDEDNTPKNLMIRAVLSSAANASGGVNVSEPEIVCALGKSGVKQTLAGLLTKQD